MYTGYPLFTMAQASSRRSRRPMTLNEDAHPATRATVILTQLARVSFDEIFDLTALILTACKGEFRRNLRPHSSTYVVPSIFSVPRLP